MKGKPWPSRCLEPSGGDGKGKGVAYDSRYPGMTEAVRAHRRETESRFGSGG